MTTPPSLFDESGGDARRFVLTNRFNLLEALGSRLIKSIRGDYLAAVGMPLKPIAAYLKSRGISFHRDVEKLYREKSFMNWSWFA